MRVRLFDRNLVVPLCMRGVYSKALRQDHVWRAPVGIRTSKECTVQTSLFLIIIIHACINRIDTDRRTLEKDCRGHGTQAGILACGCITGTQACA